MAERGLRIERREDVDLINVGSDDLRLGAEREVGVLAHDVRIVFALPEDVDAAVGTGTREHVRG